MVAYDVIFSASLWLFGPIHRFPQVATIILFFIVAAVQTNSISFDNNLVREKSRQKRKRQGERHNQLSDRLVQHDYDHFFDPVEMEMPPVKENKKQEPAPPVSTVDEDCERAVQSILDLCQSEVSYALPFSSLQHVVLQKGYSCPFHHTLLDYKSLVQSCLFFCGADPVAHWVLELSRALHPAIRSNPQPTSISICPSLVTVRVKGSTISN